MRGTMGKVYTSQSATEVAGPAVGGLLVQLITAPFALALDAVSYLCSVVSLTLIRDHESRPAREGLTRRHLGHELGEGLRFAFGEPHIRATALTASLGNFFSFITETVFLVYAVRELHFSPGLVFGSLCLAGLAAGGLGTVIGLHGTLWVAAIGYAATVIPILASPVPGLRALPGGPAGGVA